MFCGIKRSFDVPDSNTTGRSPRFVATRFPVSRAQSAKDSRMRADGEGQPSSRGHVGAENPERSRRKRRRSVRGRRCGATTDRRRWPCRRQANRSRGERKSFSEVARKSSRTPVAALFSLFLTFSCWRHDRARERGPKKSAVPISPKRAGSIANSGVCLLGPSLGVSRKSSKSGRRRVVLGKVKNQ